ncbi:O-succinylhomoserine sulfhydrylase [Phaeovulum vinaykumarii]|uniref:O-succinylhomoserine sulfhydrylase n=1 Tax=Phaeovulum vinaykumarii TaxID=407234 RepID=A0A1N7L6K5_9RHOB|nr:O-succinylhomoserine sulfhydrylase [Phaeovulum vinaykumarii]SOB99498.1 O-succinylhomoserine sulfhydrylase [Phaeovulum vinaykumarii]
MNDDRIDTKLVHSGIRRSQYGEMAEGLFLTQGYVYPTAEAAEARFAECGPDEYIYSRYANPTTRMFEERIAAVEGTEDAFAVASGMAAVHGVLVPLLKAGDHVVAARALFGSCLIVLDMFRRFGVEVTLVDGRDLDAWRAAVRPGTRAVFFESVSNPCLEVIDIAAVAEIAHAAGALVIVDNAFATPVGSRATALGADLVIYSATKHIDGGGRTLGGVILGTRDLIRGQIEPCLKHLGASISPFNAWVMLKGMETLALRVRASSATAAQIAAALDGDDRVARVLYPGLASHPDHAVARRQMQGGGTMLALDLGTRDRAFAFLNALRVFTLSNNLGDAKSIATHPATTTHAKVSAEDKAVLGIGPGLVRLSVGIEAPEDILADIEAGLAALG